MEQTKNKKPNKILQLGSTVTELRNSVESFQRGLNHAEERISNLGLGKLPRGAKRKTTEKREESPWELGNIMNRNNILIMGMPEGEEKKRDRKYIWSNMAKNFPSLGREMDIQIHKGQRTPNSLNLNRATLTHIMIKLSKFKDKELKGSKRRERSYMQGNSHKTIGGFLCRNFSGQKRLG